MEGRLILDMRNMSFMKRGGIHEESGNKFLVPQTPFGNERKKISEWDE